MKKISINLKINKGEILNELTRRSSYTALAAVPISVRQESSEGIADKIVLSSDDYPWCTDKFRMLFYKLREILLPFSSCGDEFAEETETEVGFKLTLGSNTQDAVMHYIKEIMVNYLLSNWFLERMSDKSAYLAEQCDNMITLLKMTLNRTLGNTRRPTNYF
ncbi:MAG: hypothetical protein IKU59_02070 [Bacteroidales bacterium]|nr:hypothetical protein [Bacteroidales bacterium]MBR5532080.1 hypothetical protein [Bacteroidales bacterium]